MSSAPGTDVSPSRIFGIPRTGVAWILPSLLGLALCACQADTFARRPASTAKTAEQDARRMLAAGAPREAAFQFKAAARLAHAQGNRLLEASCLLKAGESFIQARSDSAARLSLSNAVGALQKKEIHRKDRQAGLLRAHTGLGDLDFKTRRLESARAQYLQALAQASGRSRDSVLRRLVLLAEHQGDASTARAWKVRILRDDPGEQRRLELAFGTQPAAPSPHRSTPKANPYRMPPVLPRSTWGAAYARSNQDPMGRIWRLTVHHTANGFTSTSRSAVAEHIRNLQKYHVREKKWADIGYHLLIDAAGRIWQGRPLNVQGAHAGSPTLNRGNIGIALLGTFSHRRPNEAQTTALVKSLQALGAQYGIAPAKIYTHRDIREAYTECPGDALQAFVEAFRRSSGGGFAAATSFSSAIDAEPVALRSSSAHGVHGCSCCDEGLDTGVEESASAAWADSWALWIRRHEGLPAGDHRGPEPSPSWPEGSAQPPLEAWAGPPSDMKSRTARARISV